MVLTPTSNSNEDSQGSQLLIGKKVPMIGVGRRSRFSKPLPNLAASKRGDLNASASANKPCKAVKEEIQTAVDTNKAVKEEIQRAVDTNKTLPDSYVLSSSSAATENIANEGDIQTISDQNTKISIGDIQTIPDQNANETVSEENIEITSSSKANKTLPEHTDQSNPNIAINENFQNSIDRTIPEFNSERVVIEEVVLPTQEKCKSSAVDAEAVETSLISEKTFLADDVETTSDNVAVSLQDSEGERNKVVETLDIVQSSPKKISSEQERSSVIVHTSHTSVDKTKYPHLTSILSKKRAEPKKEVQLRKWKKFKKGSVPPERSKMTMADLIYWNPAKTEESQKVVATVDDLSNSNIDIEEEECVDDVDSNVQDSVPKLVISEDGQINIDQSSLFVTRNIPQPTVTEVVRKDDTTYSSFRKRPLTKHWTAKESANFYKALSLVGADFSLMEQIFPHRTRRELKQKFKREEKYNIDIINRVLYESQTFDETSLNDFMAVEVNNDDSNSTDAAKGKKSGPKIKTKRKKPEDTETCDSSAENNTDEGNKSSQKCKTTKRKKPEDAETCDSSAEYNTEEEMKTSQKGKKIKKEKLTDSEACDLSAKYHPDEVAENEKVVNKKKRKKNSKNLENNGEIGKRESKRKRIAKKLDDDFIDFDSIEELKIWDDDEELNDDDNVEENNMSDDTDRNQKELSLEKEKNSDDCVTESVPVDKNDEEYITIEYIENVVTETDLSVLGDVMAYEVVTSQTPKRGRKVNHFVSPQKNKESVLQLQISPANYTNYTPV